MLTQLELHGAARSLGVDEDSGMSGSPLDGLAEYPMEQAEFEYFETSLGSDAYYDSSQHQDLQQSLAAPPDLTSPSICDITTANENILIYDQENIPHFTADDLKFPEDMKSYGDTLQSGDVEIKFEEDIKPYGDALQSGDVEIKFEEDMKTCGGALQTGDVEIKFEEDMQDYERLAEDLYDSGLGNTNTQEDDFGFGNLYDSLDPEHHIPSPEEPTNHLWSEAAVTNNNKSKVGPLQRHALDSIFRVTDKPSRGLVLHIASELGLHHLTVKNFFANGRRRLRRAAARLNDPERTRRENERRKEKRRLAALASAAQATDGKGGVGSAGSVKAVSTRSSLPNESSPPREAPVVSPERKALMEKLADKVQRSVAQRSLAAELDLPSNMPPQQLKVPQQPVLASQSIHTLAPPQAVHDSSLTPDILAQASSDLLSQSSQELLSQPPHDLLTQTTHDLLIQSTNDFLDPTSASASLLQPSTDPWDLI